MRGKGIQPTPTTSLSRPEGWPLATLIPKWCPQLFPVKSFCLREGEGTSGPPQGVDSPGPPPGRWPDFFRSIVAVCWAGQLRQRDARRCYQLPRGQAQGSVLTIQADTGQCGHHGLRMLGAPSVCHILQ